MELKLRVSEKARIDNKVWAAGITRKEQLVAAKQHFGGRWTEDKLERIRKYLQAYMQIMKERRYRVAYIDAFAGTGYVELKREDKPAVPVFPDLAAPESQALLDGSARQALCVEPRFHKYIFIEKSRRRYQQLQKLRDEFPDAEIQLENKEANSYLLELCQRNWRSHRAVLFLDPFGMGVRWSTVEAIAATRAIDMWYLFPLGVAVNRLLPRQGTIPLKWRTALNRIFGEPDWYDNFYCRRRERGLFGDFETIERIADFKDIGDYFVRRLGTVFPGVADNPLVLYNSRNNPLFLLSFAAGNAKGAPTAVKIAQHILGGKSHGRKINN